ncbi:MAG: hypothetical protein RL173_395 [Fibrobacterota bacterium]|jgi:integrase
MPKLSIPKAPVVYTNAKPKAREYAISDGGGLYMIVTPEGSKLWCYRYTLHGHRGKVSIKGGFPTVGLKEAREAAAQFRDMIRRGEDPAEVRKISKEEAQKKEAEENRLAVRNAATFRVMAREWLDERLAHRAETTRQSIWMRLEKHIPKDLGDTPVSAVTSPKLLEVLKNIQAIGRLETAHRIRGYCSQIFWYAISTGRAENNPALALKGALRTPKVKHRAAIIDDQKFGALLRDIDEYQGWYATKFALQVLPLVFTRPGELRLAQWTEFDFEKSIWNIPAERMKMGEAHLVPLSRQVVALLRQLHKYSGGSPYLFPTPRQLGKPISAVAILNGLRRMGYGTDEQSAHGFRATARTLLDEKLRCNRAHIEAQLAHQVPDPLGNAYNRTAFLEERVKLMQTWANYLDKLKKPSNFIEPLPLAAKIKQIRRTKSRAGTV